VQVICLDLTDQERAEYRERVSRETTEALARIEAELAAEDIRGAYQCPDAVCVGRCCCE
jgi:hypothetical protein